MADSNPFYNHASEIPPERSLPYSAIRSHDSGADPASGSDPRALSASHPKVLQKDDPYAFLSTFDTVFLIDDSGSMEGSSWAEVAAALKVITPICTAHDADGIDIHFLNKWDEPHFKHITSPKEVGRIFSQVTPQRFTPTGTRLDAILQPYFSDLREKGDNLKPLNIIVITDGAPSDDLKKVIMNAAKTLDSLEAQPWQVGIQFFQVGQDEGAADALKHLDDGLVNQDGGIRDIVDTVPWGGTNNRQLNGEEILKVVLGAVIRRLDRKDIVPNRNRDEQLGC